MVVLLWAHPVAAQTKAKGKGKGKNNGESEPTFAVAGNLYRDAAGDLLPTGAVAQLGSGRLRHLMPHVFFSADGKLLVSWSIYESSIRFWDAATGQEVRRLVCTNQARFACTALAADNTTLAVVTGKGLVLVLDAETAAIRFRLQAHTSNLNPSFQMAFSADGKRLAATDTFSTVTVWRADTGEQIAHLTDQFGKGGKGGHDLMFSEDGKYITGLGGQKWELATAKHFPAPESDSRDVWLRSISSDGKLSAVSMGNGLELRDRATGKVIHDFQGVEFYGESNRPSLLQLSPDSSVLAALSMSRVLRLFDVASGKLFREFPKQLGFVPLSLAFSPDGKKLAFVRDRSKIVLWDVPGDKYVVEGKGYYDDFKAIALSPDGRFLAVQHQYLGLRLWDTSTLKPIAPDVEDVPYNGGFAFTPEGNILASWGYKVVQFWEMPSGKLLRKSWRKEMAGPVAFSPDGTVLATGSADTSKVTLANAKTGEVLRVLQEEDKFDNSYRWVRSVVFAPDGQTLAITYDAAVVLWNWRTGDKLHLLHPDRIGTPCFLADGKTLATSGPFSGVILWNVATGKPLPQGKEPGTGAIALSPDGRFLLAAGPLNTVQLWETATRTVRWQVPTHLGQVTHVACAAHGGLAVTAHEDGTVLFWDFSRMGKPAADLPGKLAVKDLDKRWSDLGSPNAVVAHQAVIELAARPEQALPLLKERVPAIYGDRLPVLAQWLDGLDSQQFKVREQATKELEKAGSLGVPALWKVLARKPGLEVTRRVEGLLAKLEPAVGQSSDAAWLQALRGIETLERLGTAEARQLLETLAKTAPETWVSREARAALQRLGTPADGK
jgi:WD40 repeat protein